MVAARSPNLSRTAEIVLGLAELQVAAETADFPFTAFPPGLVVGIQIITDSVATGIGTNVTAAFGPSASNPTLWGTFGASLPTENGFSMHAIGRVLAAPVAEGDVQTGNAPQVRLNTNGGGNLNGVSINGTMRFRLYFIPEDA
jgi:hypothetical protein